jgi:hypothetical protein
MKAVKNPSAIIFHPVELMKKISKAFLSRIESSPFQKGVKG